MWRQYNKKKPTRLESSRDVNTPLTLTTNTGGRCNWQSPQQHLAGSPARPQSLFFSSTCPELFITVQPKWSPNYPRRRPEIDSGEAVEQALYSTSNFEIAHMRCLTSSCPLLHFTMVCFLAPPSHLIALFLLIASPDGERQRGENQRE